MFTAIASLVGALIGAAAALIGAWLQTERQAKAAEAAAHQRAYGDLLVASVGLAWRVNSLLHTLQSRSGPGEGLSVVLGIRPPADAQQLHDWIAADYRPLLDAWSRTWVAGTPEMVDKANALLDACANITAIFDTAAPATLAGRVRRNLTGITTQETDQLEALWHERMKALAVARKELAELVRRETGRAPANLFSSSPAEPGS